MEKNMRVLESTEPTCMKALEKILSEPGVHELISKAAEITIEIEGKVGLVEGQAVLNYVQGIVKKDTELKFRMEPTETQGENAQLIMLVKEESLLKKAERNLEKIWKNRI